VIAGSLSYGRVGGRSRYRLSRAQIRALARSPRTDINAWTHALQGFAEPGEPDSSGEEG
jgi:hypothetical protein